MPPANTRTKTADPTLQKLSIWKQPDAYNRLLAAFAASLDSSVKFDYRKIASMYGRGATYDAIEGRFRIIRKDAAQLKEEVESGIRPAAPPRGGLKKDKVGSEDEDDEEPDTETGRKPLTPKQMHGVLAGRVSKKNTPTKPKGRAAKGVKKESDSSESVLMDEVFSGADNGFGGFPYTFGGHDSFGTMGVMDADGDFNEADV